MMCTVQVLLVPDVMRSTNINILRANPPRNLCRRLFADEDDQARRSSIKNVQNESFETLNKRNTEKWNFNFLTETPLPGRYQWVPVHSCTERVPSIESLVKESSLTVTKTDKLCPAKSPKQTVNLNKTAIQSKITDFLHQKKRHRTAVEDLDSPKLKSRRLDATIRSGSSQVN